MRQPPRVPGRRGQRWHGATRRPFRIAVPRPDLADGEIRRVSTLPPVAVTRIGERWYAFADRCPHMDTPLSRGSIAGNAVLCSLHQASYSLEDGQVLSGPAIRPLPIYEITVVDDSLLIRRRGWR